MRFTDLGDTSTNIICNSYKYFRVETEMYLMMHSINAPPNIINGCGTETF